MVYYLGLPHYRYYEASELYAKAAHVTFNFSAVRITLHAVGLGPRGRSNCNWLSQLAELGFGRMGSDCEACCGSLWIPSASWSSLAAWHGRSRCEDTEIDDMSPGQCSAQMVARILLLEVQEHKDWAAFLDWLPEQGPINLFSLLRSSAPQWVADFRFKPICPYDPIRLLLSRLSSKGVQTHHLFRARHDMAFHLPTSMMTLDPQFGSPKMGGHTGILYPKSIVHRHVLHESKWQFWVSVGMPHFLSVHFHFMWLKVGSPFWERSSNPFKRGFHWVSWISMIYFITISSHNLIIS